MQNTINRLSPSIDNVIETRNGRTRSKFRKGEDILNNAKAAGYELIKDGKMSTKTLNEVSRPLISRKEFELRYNRAL